MLSTALQTACRTQRASPPRRTAADAAPNRPRGGHRFRPRLNFECGGQDPCRNCPHRTSDEAAVPDYILPIPPPACRWQRRIGCAHLGRSGAGPSSLSRSAGTCTACAPGERGRIGWRTVELDRKALGGAATRKLVEVETATGADVAPLVFRVDRPSPQASSAPGAGASAAQQRGPESADPSRETSSHSGPGRSSARGTRRRVPRRRRRPGRARRCMRRARLLLRRSRVGPDGSGTLAAGPSVRAVCSTPSRRTRISTPRASHSSVIPAPGRPPSGAAPRTPASRWSLRTSRAAEERRSAGGGSGRPSPTSTRSFRTGSAPPSPATAVARTTSPSTSTSWSRCLAPRSVYVASAQEDLWADPKGEFLSLVHAGPVYALFGRRGLGASELPPAGVPLHGDSTRLPPAPGRARPHALRLGALPGLRRRPTARPLSPALPPGRS